MKILYPNVSISANLRMQLYHKRAVWLHFHCGPFKKNGWVKRHENNVKDIIENSNVYGRVHLR